MPIRRKEEPVVDRILECLLVYMCGYQYQYLRFSRTGNEYTQWLPVHGASVPLPTS